MGTLLKVENLSKTFRLGDEQEVHALRDVSFELYAHETLGVVGESGSGKSTLARVLMRLTQQQEGNLWFEGEEITHHKGSKLKLLYQDMQMIFQSPLSSFNPRMTLSASIGEGLINQGLSKKEVKMTVESLLEQCGLNHEIGQRYPNQVSGGQCQRAAIARALAMNPKLLICDEITSSLDVTVQKQIMNLLKKIQSETGIAYVFISHDLALVQEMCQRVMVMQKGVVVESGTVDEIILSPQSEYTQKLIDSVLF